METNFEKHGNHEILDFVNSHGNRFFPEDDDRILTYDNLLAFCTEFDILTKSEAARLVARANDLKDKSLDEALTLRELLFSVLIRIAKQSDETACDEDYHATLRELGKRLHSAEQEQVLVLKDGGLDWNWTDPDDPMRPTRELALIAKKFIEECDRTRLRKCAMHDCGVLFLDRSKSGRRTWCSMSDCGNKAKVSRFRQRKSKDASTSPA